MVLNALLFLVGLHQGVSFAYPLKLLVGFLRPLLQSGRGLIRVLETDLAECLFKENPQGDPALAQVARSSPSEAWRIVPVLSAEALHPRFLDGERTACWARSSFYLSTLTAPEWAV